MSHLYGFRFRERRVASSTSISNVIGSKEKIEFQIRSIQKTYNLLTLELKQGLNDRISDEQVFQLR